MTPVQEKLAEIKAKREEQDRLYRTLDLWAAVEAQGIEPEEVESFGYDPKLLPHILKRKRDWAIRFGGGDPWVDRLTPRVLVYTYVRLKAGGIRTLDPPLKAV
jgi:hypothetical protein